MDDNIANLKRCDHWNWAHEIRFQRKAFSIESLPFSNTALCLLLLVAPCRTLLPRDKQKGSWSGLGSAFLELVGREFDAIKFDCILDMVGPELDG